MLLGNMQDQPLLVSSLLRHAERFHAEGEIVSNATEGNIHRTNYGNIARRARQLANALRSLGIQDSDRVGTLAWNGYRHMELYFAVSGMGAILHTINPRLFPEQIEYIAKHAEDQVLFFDITFAPLVEKLAPSLTGIKHFVAMTDRAHLPTQNIPRLLCYEELLAAASADFDWPIFDENTASSLCYTSGTTGNPKGVLYSHRSTLLHSFAACSADVLGVSAKETLLLVVPMFHVNAWGMPYAGAMCGAKLVLPGAGLDGKSVYELMKNEKVSLALGVPTVWLMLFNHVHSQSLQPKNDLQLSRVVIGGSAAAPTMIDTFDRVFGAEVIHAWGMTETSPIGTACNFLLKHQGWDDRARNTLRQKQGRAIFGVDLRLVDDEGKILAHDGQSSGHLQVRGAWVVKRYFQETTDALTADQWFATGDVATIDADGYMQITDRSKDIIKSGGEWISSIDLENAVIGHPDIAEAAVIGVPHSKWQERPIVVAVKKTNAQVTQESLMQFLADKVAKWWLPDDIIFVESLPHTATGKLQKMTLRSQFADYRLKE